MTRNVPKNVAASVRQRLLNLARNTEEDFQLVLTRYVVERLLYRLCRSRYREKFILKGAMLFQLWGGEAHRPTRDLDLLGQGLDTPARLCEIFKEICATTVPDDGVRFLAETVDAERIKSEEECNGIRTQLDCRLENARIRLQVDIGYGDIVTPQADKVTFPATLDFPAPVLKAYPKESVIAEKLQAMIWLGIANSRMKDFYDVWYLAGHFSFAGAMLSQAIANTFERRETAIPSELPLPLSSEFALDFAKQTQWNAFLRKGKLVPSQVGLGEVVDRIRAFVFPVLEVLAAGRGLDKTWTPGTGWG